MNVWPVEISTTNVAWLCCHWLILQSFQPSNLYWFVCFWPKNWSWPRLHKSDANYGIVRSWRFNERSMNVHLLLFVWEKQSCTRKQSLGCKTLFGYLRSIFSFTIPLRFNEECYLIGVFTYPIHLWCFHKLCFLGPITDITTSFFFLQSSSCNSYLNHADFKVSYCPTRRGSNSKKLCSVSPPDL